MHMHAHTHVCDGLRSPSWCRACVLTGKVAIRQISWICVGVGNRNSFRLNFTFHSYLLANLFFSTPTTHHNLFPSLPLVCTLSHTHTNTCPAFFSRCVRSIETGSVLQSFKHQLHRSKKIDFIEQFNEKLLVKQENEPLQIIDIRTGTRTEVASSQFMTPSAFIFLYENQLFLTFRRRRSLLEKHVFFVNLKRDIVCLCLI